VPLVLQILGCQGLSFQGTIRDFTTAYLSSEDTTSLTTVNVRDNKNFLFRVDTKGRWFETDPEDPFNTKPHSIEFTTSGSTKLQFSSNPFYPIDGELYGNEGQPNNNYFTYEFSTIFTPSVDLTLNFKGSCTMWVATCTTSCNVQASQTSPSTGGTTFAASSLSVSVSASVKTRLIVAYVHHCDQNPALQIEIPQIEQYKRQCDITTAGVKEQSLYPLTGLSLRNAQSAATTLSILRSDISDTFTSAWHPTPLGVREGFQVDFDYTLSNPVISGGYSGFAFVVQNSTQGADAQGETGPLQYDLIEKGLAIEAELTSSSEITLSVNSRISGQARPYSTLASTSCTGLSTTVSVYIRYVPVEETVYVDWGACSLTATVDVGSFNIMWNDGAYVGFTGGVGGPNTAAVTISSWGVEWLQATGTFSRLVTAGVLWAQFGQHINNGATKTQFNRITDIITSNYLSGNQISIPQSESFKIYKANDGNQPNQIEIVYFENETPRSITQLTNNQGRTQAAVLQTYTDGVTLTGASKSIVAAATHGIAPSFKIVPQDGCGNPAFNSGGLSSIFTVSVGTVQTSNTPSISCSTGIIAIETASYCGVDVTSTVATTCNGQTSCASATGLTCSSSAQSWENLIYSVSWECYDQVAPIIQKESSTIGVDSTIFGFYESIYGIYIQQRLTGNYLTNIRLNGDSIGTFSTQVEAGAIVGGSCTFTPLSSTTFTAGVSKNLSIFANDQYGNPVTSSSVQFTVQGSVSGGPFTSTQVGSTNEHVVTILLTQAVGAQSLSIRVDGASVAGSPISVTVVPNDPVSATVSQPSSMTATNTSGSTGITATISLQDAYKNAVTGSTYSGSISVEARIIGVTPEPTFTANSFTGDVVLVPDIYYEIAGPYTVDYYLNGARIVQGNPLTINPASPTVSKYTLTASGGYAIGGGSNYVSIQTRDIYGNVITTDTSSQFTVTFDAPSGTDPTATCSGSSPSNCVHFGEGIYRASFTPVVSGSYSIVVTGGPTLAISVNPGGLSVQSDLVLTSFAVTAGAAGNFQITAKDVNGNVRDHRTDDSFVITATSVSTGTSIDVQGLGTGSNGVYSGTFTLTYPAGTWVLSATLTDGSEISNSTSRMIEVSPGATAKVTDANEMNGPTGEGLVGGASGSSVSFTWNAFDAYGNRQFDSVSGDAFSVLFPGESTSPSVAQTSNTNLWTCSYTVPAYDPLSPTFPILILLNNTSPGSVFPYSAGTIASDNDPNYAAVVSTITPFSVDSSLIVTIENQDSGGNVVNVSQAARTYFLKFYDSTQTLVEGTGSPSCAMNNGESRCNATINAGGNLHLTQVGTFKMRIVVGTTNFSPNNETVTTTTGLSDEAQSSTTVSSATVSAGTQITLTSIIKDRFGNLYTEGTRTVVFVLSGACPSGGCSDVTASWNSGSNSYTATYTPTKSGTLLVRGREGVTDLGSNAAAVTVNPAAASASASSLGSAGTQYRAGTEESITVTLVDQYSNPISGSPSAFTTSLQSNPSISFSVSETSTPSVYEVRFTPQVSSTYFQDGTFTNLQLAVKIGASDIQNSPADIEVQPDDVDATQTSVASIPELATAGDYFTLNFTVRDQFGNAWKQDYSQLRVRLTDRLGAESTSTSFGSGQDFLRPVLLGSGGYMFPTRCTVANGFASYELEFIGKSGVWENAPLPALLSNKTYILSGPPSATRSIIVNGGLSTTTFSAGFTTSFQVMLRDDFGNLRSSNSSGAVNLTLSYEGRTLNDNLESGINDFVCADIGIPTYTGTKLSSAVNCTDALCTIQLSGTVAGEFRFRVYVNGVEATSWCGRITINPGSVNPDGCSLNLGTLNENRQCQPFTGSLIPSTTINSTLCGRVNTADIYGNRLSSELVGYTITLSNPTTRSCANIIENSTNTEFQIYEAKYVPPGMYDISFRGTKIGNYHAVATINATAVGANDAQSCRALRLTAGYVYKFKPTVDPYITFSGVPSSIFIRSNDSFDNVVASGGHQFSLNLNLLSTEDDDITNDGISYSISITESVRLSSGLDRIDFNPEWSGVYRVQISLSPDSRYVGPQYPRFVGGKQNGAIYETRMFVNSSICAKQSSSVEYRCTDNPEDGQCVTTYASCPSTPVICSGSTPIYCPASGTCVSFIGNCSCIDTGKTRCKNGMCVTDSSQCIENVVTCEGSVNMNDQYDVINCVTEGSSSLLPGCAPTVGECPSVRVCPPGLVICDDGISCANSTSFCPTFATIDAGCPSGEFACNNGRCVSNWYDCPSYTSCGAGKVVCGDGSCQTDSTLCPSLFKCFGLRNVRCADGSCAKRTEDCPSLVTCAPGLVLCENNKCAVSLSECSAAQTCPLSSRRCPDGSCVGDYTLCSTPVTCSPSSPVLCDDGSCHDSGFDCNQVNPELINCDRTFGTPLKTCPGGFCADTFAQCPTLTSCPETRPVKCPDGSCQSNSSACNAHPRDACPSDFPVVCPDGSCRSSLIQCPSWYKCPTDAPVKCDDGSCVAATTDCSLIDNLMDCPSGYVRCPTIGCSPDFRLCPSVHACPLDSSGSSLLQRCVDGTCRSSCLGVTYNKCPDGLVTCPSPAAGYPSCAPRLSDCPTSYRCPDSRPVLCNDRTCQSTSDVCPAWPTSFSRVPCADGGWAPQASSCGTPVTCPRSAPIKCQDEQCRATLEDCYEIEKDTACPDADPYYCLNGECNALLSDCATTFQCSNVNLFPVKCAALNISVSNAGTTDNSPARCAANYDVCDDPYQSTMNTKMFVQTCPNRWSHCRDTTCVESPNTLCSDLQCPDYQPYVCTNGLCATNSTACPMSNGCPFDRPYKCIGGSCASRESQCPTPAACGTGLQRCPDGSCNSDATNCAEADGCPVDQFRCADGTCINYDLNSGEVTDTNYCINKETTEAYENACPPFQPFRCPGGLCAASSNHCPKTTYGPAADTCPEVEVKLLDGSYMLKTYPVMCSDGSCVDSEAQCPRLHACIDGYVRCGDGSCRSSESLCPSDNTCPSEKPFRCSNGMCAPTIDYCISPVSATGCPCQANQFDADGIYCLEGKEKVKCRSSILGGLCGTSSTTCISSEDDYLRPNGCNFTAPYKCWTGECKVSASACLRDNGCPQGLPSRCGDGSCQINSTMCAGYTAATGAKACGDGTTYDPSVAGNAASCSTYTRCPVSTPYRCADGTCKKYRAFDLAITDSQVLKSALSTDIFPETCEPQLVCPSHKPHRCADYSCAISPDQCPPVFTCSADTPYICPDLSCAANSSACAVTDSCPTSSPILCPDGSCRDNLALCSSEEIAPRCNSAQVSCFDGVCRNSTFECIEYSYLVHSPSQTSMDIPNINANLDVCPTAGNTKMAVCSDGSCVPFALMDLLCPPAPACPASHPHRCPDSECVTDSTQCSVSSLICSGQYQACPDGTCRDACAPFDGCAGNKPYYCPSNAATLQGQCVASSAECSSSSNPSSLAVHPEGFEMGDFTMLVATSRIPPTCTGPNCNRDVPVSTQVFEVGSNDVSHGIAVSSFDLSVRGEIIIPGGAIVSSGQTTFKVEQVSDSQLNEGVNYVHRSRQGDFDSGTFSMEQTVLSPAFKCVASQDPFSLQIQYRARLDNAQLINPEEDKKDICLATIVPASKAWVCVAEFVEERNDQPIVNTTESRLVGKGSGLFQSCLDENGDQLIYAFAHIPAQSSVSESKGNLFYIIQIIVVLCVIGALSLVFGIAWWTNRARQYRIKMKEVQAQNAKVDEQIQDMKMYGGGLGNAGKNEEIDMVANPMVVKFKGLQEQIQEYKEKTGYYEDEAKRQNNTINRLEKEREALNNAIKQLKTQLEEQRHRIMQQKKLREQQAAAAEMVNEAVISAEISPREGGPAAVIAEPIEDPDDDEEEDDLGREVI